MSDPSRAQILLRLVAGAAYPAELAKELDMTRSNVSNHLSCLRGCGIVVGIPQGRQTRYEIADQHLTRAFVSLVDVVLAVEDREPCSDELCEIPQCCAVMA